MAERYRSLYTTPEVQAAQARYYGRPQAVSRPSDPDTLGQEEIEFIQRRDSFYMASVNPDGWPYLQHRGGPAGFLKALSPHTLGFADFRGNRQLLTTGHLATNDRVALFLMDYPKRERLKITGHARLFDAREPENRALLEQLSPSLELRSRIERLFVIEVVGFDWNCPQHITPRYTLEEFEAGLAANQLGENP